MHSIITRRVHYKTILCINKPCTTLVNIKTKIHETLVTNFPCSIPLDVSLSSYSSEANSELYASALEVV